MDEKDGKRETDDKETIKRLSERIAWLEALNELQALRLRRMEGASASQSCRQLPQLPRDDQPRAGEA